MLKGFLLSCLLKLIGLLLKYLDVLSELLPLFLCLLQLSSHDLSLFSRDHVTQLNSQVLNLHLMWNSTRARQCICVTVYM